MLKPYLNGHAASAITTLNTKWCGFLLLFMWVEIARHAIVWVFSNASTAFSFFVYYYLRTVCSSHVHSNNSYLYSRTKTFVFYISGDSAMHERVTYALFYTYMYSSTAENIAIFGNKKCRFWSVWWFRNVWARYGRIVPVLEYSCTNAANQSSTCDCWGAQKIPVPKKWCSWYHFRIVDRYLDGPAYTKSYCNLE